MFWVDKEYNPKEVSHDYVRQNGYTWFTNAGSAHYYCKFINGLPDYQNCVKVTR